MPSGGTRTTPWTRASYSLYTELSLYGEQFVRVFTDPLTGEIRLRQLDPLLIERIETAAEDIEQVHRYRVRGVGNDPGYWVAAAEMEHLTINRVSNALRGRSDLAALLPWPQTLSRLAGRPCAD